MTTAADSATATTTSSVNAVPWSADFWTIDVTPIFATTMVASKNFWTNLEGFEISPLKKIDHRDQEVMSSSPARSRANFLYLVPQQIVLEQMPQATILVHRICLFRQLWLVLKDLNELYLPSDVMTKHSYRSTKHTGWWIRFATSTNYPVSGSTLEHFPES